MSIRAILLCLVVCASNSVRGAKIELVAGGGAKEPPCAANEVALREPFGVEFTPSGDLIIVEMAAGERVLRMDTKGEVLHVAGTGRKGFGGDGGDPRQA